MNYLKEMGFGLTTGSAMVIAFCITAAWWVVCTLPLLKSYRQKAYTEHTGSALTATFRRLGRTFREVRKEKHIFLYLVAFFFFIDGVYTIIGMATTYGSSLGLDSTGLLLALLVTQIVAFPCSILFGKLSARYDTGLLIKVCIVCYSGITLFGVFLQSYLLCLIAFLIITSMDCIFYFLRIRERSKVNVAPSNSNNVVIKENFKIIFTG